MKKVMYSVVIPSYNSRKSIEHCLNAVLSQDFDEKFEVIVVDSSKDETEKIVREKYPQVRLIKLEHKTDQGKARNIGLSYAMGEIIFFIDSDCVAQKNWMKNMVRGFELGFHAIGGPVINANPETTVSWAGYFFEFNDLLPYRQRGQVEHVGSCNACYKREVFLKHGGFPESLKFSVEDLVYNLFLSKRAVKISSEPDAVVAHFHREKFSSYMKHQYKLARGTVQLLENIEIQGLALKSIYTSGRWLIKFRPFAFLVLPFLPIIKFVRINSHVIRSYPSIYVERPLFIPLLVAGLMAWLAGMTKELYFGEHLQEKELIA